MTKTNRSMTARGGAWLAAALLFAGAPSAAMAQTCPEQFVTGYYAGYYAFHPDYQAPEHVDMTAMTHLVFARIGPGGGQFGGDPGEIVLGNVEAQTNRRIGPGAPHRTIEEYLVGRAHQVGTKALIMLGGAGDNAGFRASLAPEVRPTFVANLVDYMVSRAYDGIDVDFEGFLDADDRALLEAFVADLRAAADAHPRFAEHPVIITFPGGLKNMNIDVVTEHDKRMAGLVDQYNIMSYGAGWFGQGWDSTTHSPLTGHTSTRPMDVASTVQAFVNEGVPRCKIGMGIGFYGMMYKPPFSAPGQTTDGDPSRWSTDDNLWNFARMTKLGYLSNGIYLWDAPTQTGYRTYPGGFAPAGGGTTAGYISYEDEAGIAAKGAWSLSAAPGAGAGGTIIWLVNYGTTNGVNNPLLTAVKKAFLDPNATEPGPSPNPGELPPLPPEAPEDPAPPPPPPPPPPVPAEDLSFSTVITSSWQTGYCVDVTVENNGETPGSWTIELPFYDTIDALWEARYTLSEGKLVVSGPSYEPAIYPGQPRVFGYCAKIGEAPPPPTGPANVTGSITVSNDWGAGWCALASIANSGGATAHDWTITLPMPTTGTVTAVYNARFTQDGNQLTIFHPTWKTDLGAGESAGEVQVCGSR